MSEKPAEIPHQVFREAFDHSPIGVAVVGRNNEWIYVNEACAEAFGYALAEWPHNRTWRDFTVDKDIDGDQASADPCLQRNGPDGYRLDKRYHRKNEGEWFWAKLIVHVVRDEEGEFLYFVSYIIPKERPAFQAALFAWALKHWKPVGAFVTFVVIALGWAFGFVSDEKFKALKEILF
jgi:PAS domain S-box-containing protein